jgi:hypothetical protein
MLTFLNLQDPSLTRCYGVDKKIIDCDWDYLSTLKSIAPPHDRMPRLQDLLEYIAAPELERIWILLDIKVRTLLSLHKVCFSLPVF